MTLSGTRTHSTGTGTAVCCGVDDLGNGLARASVLAWTTPNRTTLDHLLT